MRGYVQYVPRCCCTCSWFQRWARLREEIPPKQGDNKLYSFCNAPGARACTPMERKFRRRNLARQTQELKTAGNKDHSKHIFNGRNVCCLMPNVMRFPRQTTKLLGSWSLLQFSTDDLGPNTSLYACEQSQEVTKYSRAPRLHLQLSK